MNYIIELALIGITSGCFSLVITNFLVKFMKKQGIVDVPDNRRAHRNITPRGGGIALVIIVSAMLPAAEYYLFANIDQSLIILRLLWPVAIVSFWDDISHAGIPVRLLVQSICALLAMMWFVHPSQILHSDIPVYLDLVIGSFALLTFLNVYNFLDGIDGITASQTIHLSSTLLILCFLNYEIILHVDIIIILCTIILFWAVGFIYFNWQPAKIFLGDIGSVSIGFLLGTSILAVAASSVKLFGACLIACLYYIADGGLTILIRTLKGERVWEPHLQHFFQKSVASGSSHKQVVIRIIKCNFFLMLFAVNSLYYPVISMIGAFLAVVIILVRSVI